MSSADITTILQDRVEVSPSLLKNIKLSRTDTLKGLSQAERYEDCTDNMFFSPTGTLEMCARLIILLGPVERCPSAGPILISSTSPLTEGPDHFEV